MVVPIGGGRDVKAVRTDVHALLNGGLFQQGNDSSLLPKDSVHAAFPLKAT